MAIGKTLVFTGLNIAPAGTAALGGTANSFALHLTESAEVTLTPVTDVVEDNQTLVSAYDVSFAVNCYNVSLIDDAVVYKDASASPQKGNIAFLGTTGAQNVVIDGVIINGTKVFDGNRTAVRLTGTKRTTNVDLGITLA
jgi:hypothetical protein